jgi:hypothetical protein
MASSSVPIVPLTLDDIQGNIFGGFNKDFQANLFLQFTSAAIGRAWIGEVADQISDSSSSNVIEFNNEFKRLKKQDLTMELSGVFPSIRPDNPGNADSLQI